MFVLGKDFGDPKSDSTHEVLPTVSARSRFGPFGTTTMFSYAVITTGTYFIFLNEMAGT